MIQLKRAYNTHEYLLSIFLILVLFTGCAYFNTFYNAQQYFKEAENQRLENIGERLPKETLNNYKIVIEKCEKVLAKYPDSKYKYEAILLSGISRFYRGEIKKAEIVFRTLESENPVEYGSEAQFWLALCKSKQSKPQAALDDLNDLISTIGSRDFKARIYLARAAIMLDENMRNTAYQELELAAELTDDAGERGQIYYEIAFLAKADGDYKHALRAFKQVLKNSVSKTRISEASLEIIRIHRLMGDYRKVESLVKEMLENDEFRNDFSSAILEIGKYHYDNDEISVAEPILVDITTDYPRTAGSAEALFMLGQIQLLNYHKVDTAKIFFDRSMKEINKNPFRDKARVHIKSIMRYEELWKSINDLSVELDNLFEESIPESDSINVAETAVVDTIRIFNSMAENYYELALIEYNAFRNLDSAKVLLNLIIENYDDTDFHPKALFTMHQVLLNSLDSSAATDFKDQLFRLYPQSEYAQYIKEKANIAPESPPTLDLLVAGEQLWETDMGAALLKYKSILTLADTSNIPAKAALFLAHHYDYTDNNADSAFHYYSWLKDNYPESEQATLSNDRYKSLFAIFNTETIIPSDTTGTNEN